jgi:acylphosphatase
VTRCRRFIVSGLVQGVFYRATTQDTARRLHLTGWVRNLPDGRVELVACGAEARLAELETWLWQGPPAARVDSVLARDEPWQEFNGFGVRR